MFVLRDTSTPGLSRQSDCVCQFDLRLSDLHLQVGHIHGALSLNAAVAL